MNKVLIVGSTNIDLLFSVKEFPKNDQTVMCDNFNQIVGGKGFNQASFCQKLGLKTNFITKIGKDDYGDFIKDELRNLKLLGCGVMISKNKKSGIASIYLNKNGNKEIVVLPGANYDLLYSDLDEQRELIFKSDIVITQLELPIITIEYLFEKAKENNKTVILNASPGRKLTKKILKNTDYLIMNHSDLEIISNVKDKIDEMLKKILTNFSGNLIVKKLNEGYYYSYKNEIKFVKSEVLNENSKNLILDDDIFVSCFVYFLTKNNNFEESVLNAARVTKKYIEEKINLEDLIKSDFKYEHRS